MSEQQLYIAVGLPTIVALIGILVNIGYFVGLNGRIGSLETRINSLETRLDNRISSLEAKFDILAARSLSSITGWSGWKNV